MWQRIPESRTPLGYGIQTDIRLQRRCDPPSDMLLFRFCNPFVATTDPAREIELRVDANGAFSPADAMDKLNRLAELDLHSIEQPIRAGQLEEMARLAE